LKGRDDSKPQVNALFLHFHPQIRPLVQRSAYRETKTAVAFKDAINFLLSLIKAL
jgi:hypothetical protein